MINSIITGTGSASPKRVLRNADLPSDLDTSDEWIQQRTGIEQRYISDDSETTVSLGVTAAERALSSANLTIADIDMVLLATSTPNHTFPASAVEIQRALGMTHGFAFDVQAVCSGFIFALTTADTYIKAGLAKRVIVIGSETFSRILDWSDRSTCVLFGDGAGAVILESSSDTSRGILTTQLRSDGSHMEKLYVDGGASTTGTVGKLRMEGREVFKHAVSMITDVVESAFSHTGLSSSDLDWFIPHQANRRIIESSAKKLGIPLSKTIINVGKYGNTSAASIPLALDDAVCSGKLSSGDLVLLEAMGGGFTWGAILLRW